MFERHIPDTYYQASFKPPAIAAMIFLAKVADPIAKLEQIISTSKARSSTL